MGVGPATWKKNRIEEEVERETAVRFRTLVVRNSILVLGLWPSCRVKNEFRRVWDPPARSLYYTLPLVRKYR